ncbi:peptidylprolyl isomerase [Prosthecobacter sp.]|uniref:peptidylprolyl isomerase n=1 Tax=Prosthecobacter sp. TaxID=1965333 RepID=UPI001D5AC45F|nr:peptidylprolyl isomerase [Prosthecobacter sp.]MCB1277901.1 peptidylprolyl isomerase [Prosthecobacter sp.]
MSFSLHGFPWRFAAYFIAAGYLMADLYACKGPLHARLMAGRGSSPEGAGGGFAAEVYGRPITRLEVEEMMREQLWKRNESWAALGTEARKQTRWLALETLVNDRIIRAFRIMNGIDHVPPVSLAKREAEMMKRQFANGAEFPGRVAGQQQTEKSLDEGIYDAQLDEAWIAEKIAHRLKEITAKEVREWYDEFKDTLRIPRAFHAAHIFLTRHDKTKPDREAEIREVHRQLIAKEKTFAQLAAEHSDDDRSKVVGGDLGWISRGRLPEDFMSAVEKLPVGEFSGPVLTKLGWHLIIVMERHEPRLPTFEEAADEIMAMLTSQRREEAVRSLIAELRERSQKPTQFVFYHPQVVDQAEPAP